MAIEEASPDPVAMAAAIHSQLIPGSGAVPVFDIAEALDIDEIRVEPLDNFEGALITTEQRGFGKILCNANSSAARQRFTVAHELGHFLNTEHQPNSGTNFLCERMHLCEMVSAGAERHRIQEAEANAFAIELLAPRERVTGYCVSPPNLSRAIALGRDFKISNEASFRRYVELYPGPLAIVSSFKGQVMHIDLTERFPPISLAQGDRLPNIASAEIFRLPPLTSVDSRWFLVDPTPFALFAQGVIQAGGWARTLLYLSDEHCPTRRQGDLFEFE